MDAVTDQKQDQKIKVLYIAGFSFSGSTVLSRTVGQIEDFFMAGELRVIWDGSMVNRKPCGCGTPFHDCSVWSAIMNRAYGGVDKVDVKQMLNLRERRSQLPLMLMPGGEAALKRKLAPYLDNLEKLYTAIQAETGCRVIVDSSKSPLYAYTLSMIPSIDLYVVHLMRDARGVQYSCIRRNKGSERVAHYNVVEECLNWDFTNLVLEIFSQRFKDRYLMLHYEEFIEDPRSVLQQMLDLIGEEATQLPVEGERQVLLDINHSVNGNGDRFKTGAIALRRDQTWREVMKPSDKKAVTALTLPFLWRYGYLAPSVNRVESQQMS